MFIGTLLAAPTFLAAAPMPEGAYLVGGGFFELGDSDRQSDNGLGLNLGLGMTLDGRRGEALELAITGLERDRDVDGREDYQQSLMVTWLKAFDAKYMLLDATPYTLLGAGGIREDVRGDDHLHLAGHGGAGVRFALPIDGWLLRTEALAQLQLNDESVPNNDMLLDFQVRIGLQVPIGKWSMPIRQPDHVDDAPLAEVPPPCEGAVYDPISGRQVCASDEDRDGVVDEADACPQTPRGSPVDVRGCPASVDSSSVQDKDADGVIDSADKCPLTAPSLVVDANGCVVQQSVTLESVRFETASALLTEGAKSILDGLAKTLRNQTNLFTQIRGHTDDEGQASVNQVLSQQRAESVRQYLVKKAVPSSRLTAQGLGESQPIVPNDTSEGREKNRRVEFVLTVRGTPDGS